MIGKFSHTYAAWENVFLEFSLHAKLFQMDFFYAGERGGTLKRFLNS